MAKTFLTGKMENPSMAPRHKILPTHCFLNDSKLTGATFHFINGTSFCERNFDLILIGEQQVKSESSNHFY